jgi:hypothetical protein
MAKIIAWLVLIFVVLFALRMIGLRNARAKRNIGKSGNSGDAAQATSAGPGAEPMVRCIRCGVYLPRVEALEVRGGYACAAGRCVDHA